MTHDCFGHAYRPPKPWWKRLLDRINPFAIYRRWKLYRKFQKIVIPIVQVPFAKLDAHELVNVQPMTAPKSDIFNVDYTYAVRKEKK